MNELINYLNYIAAIGAPVCIYDDEGCDAFYYGLILCASEEYISSYHISPDGRFDGIGARLTDEIAGINLDPAYAAKYIEKMEKITPRGEYEMLKDVIDPREQVKSILKIALRDHTAVTLRFLGEDLEFADGYVTSIDGDTATLRCVDEFGYEKVDETFSISDVAEIECMSLSLRTLDKLWKINYRR